MEDNDGRLISEDEPLLKEGVSYQCPDPKHYKCPKHGIVTTYMLLGNEGDEFVFCMQCYAEFLKKNLPVLEEINNPGVTQ